MTHMKTIIIIPTYNEKDNIDRLITAIFSTNRGDSFLGASDYYIVSFFLLALSGLFYILMVNHLTTTKRWRVILDTTILVGGISAALFLWK